MEMQLMTCGEKSFSNFLRSVLETREKVLQVGVLNERAENFFSIYNYENLLNFYGLEMGKQADGLDYFEWYRFINRKSVFDLFLFLSSFSIYDRILMLQVSGNRQNKVLGLSVQQNVLS